MGRARLSVIAIGLTVAIALSAATGAGQARERSSGKVEIQSPRTAAFLDLGKERGYELYLYVPTKRVVLLYAYRRGGVKGGPFGSRYSLYAVRNRGDLQRGVVRARFGSLGRVDLRFRPTGRLRRDEPRSGCEGGSETIRYGSFVGHLSFRGKGNYFHVSSSRGEAYLAHSPRLRCEPGRAEEAPPRSLRRYASPLPLFPDDRSIALLYASGHSHGRQVGITAVHTEGSPPGAEVQLGILESGHGMAIGHGLYLTRARGTLLTSLPGEHPATATLAPPAPFFGKAVYSEEDGAWSGSLGVRLGGVTAQLTGPDFHVHLCVANPLKDKNRCEFFKAELPPDERAARAGWSLR
jgi:hypothetical protein